MSTPITQLPVAVLGAGPVGLAAAAKLIERGLPFFILEAGERVGANLLDYAHVRLFSPWQYNVDHSVVKLLEPTGWVSPNPTDLPLAGELVERAMQPFAELPQMREALHLRTKVVSVSREGFDKVKSAGRDQAPFVIRAIRDGKVVELRARAVIDSTGTWNTPNPVGASGLPAIGEREAASHIFYGIPDVLGTHRARYAGKKVLVVGAGHSAANGLLALAELAKQVPSTQLVWSVRTPVSTRVFGGGDADALPARGALGLSLRRLCDTGALEFNAGLRITELRQEGGKLLVEGVDRNGDAKHIDGVDEIICATGQRPDLSPTSELRVKLDSWLESTEALGPLIDPNEHSCGTVRPHGHRELAHPRVGPLHGWREELRPCAHVPDGNGLRTGSLGGGGDCRRHRGRRPGAARAARDGCLQQQWQRHGRRGKWRFVLWAPAPTATIEPVAVASAGGSCGTKPRGKPIGIPVAAAAKAGCCS